jgi:small GTP-binding protein
MENTDLKVVLVGNAGVGKTTMMCRWQRGGPISMGEAMPTIGAAYAHSVVRQTAYPDTVLRIWDTAGAERYRALMPMYVRLADVILLVFDLSAADSLDALVDYWYPSTAQVAPLATRVVVGNKMDLVTAVSDDAISAVRDTVHAEAYMQTSARTGQGLDLLFEQVARYPRLTRLDPARLPELGPAPGRRCCS